MSTGDKTDEVKVRSPVRKSRTWETDRSTCPSPVEVRSMMEMVASLGTVVSVGSASYVTSAQASAARRAVKALLITVGHVAGPGW